MEKGFAPEVLKERRLRYRELTEIGIRHSLLITDIHARLLLLTRTGPITLTHWQEGPTLWDSVAGRDGAAAIPVRPDAYFVLKHSERPPGKNVFHVFLEADRSTMSHERMTGKIEGYVRYHERRLHARKYPGMHSFLVATVTQTRSRADELRKDLLPLVPRSASREAYLFIPFAKLTLATLLPRAAAAMAA
jgi:hypothetical protein